MSRNPIKGHRTPASISCGYSIIFSLERQVDFNVFTKIVHSHKKEHLSTRAGGEVFV